MSGNRIKAILLQELFITRRSLEVVMDTIFFSLISVVVFGLMSLFLAGGAGAPAGHYFLLGLLLWEVIRITQYSLSVGSLWNIWSRNLSNLFITPLSLTEYLLAQILSGVLKALVLFLIIALLSLFLFDFNVFSFGALNLLLYFTNLTVFAWSTGIIILGFIFWYGTRIQALAWGLVFLFQPLTAAFFPVSTLPPWLATIAFLLPPTYVFEAARANLAAPTINWTYMGVALAENIIYFLLALWLFKVMFDKSRDSGQFVKNEQ